MSSFKEQVARDITAVFINPEEFADTHTIEGESVTCVVDQDERLELSGADAFGIDHSVVHVFVKSDVLEELGLDLGHGAHLNLDDKLYTVDSIEEQMGVSVITLTVPTTY